MFERFRLPRAKLVRLHLLVVDLCFSRPNSLITADGETLSLYIFGVIELVLKPLKCANPD